MPIFGVLPDSQPLDRPKASLWRIEIHTTNRQDRGSSGEGEAALGAQEEYTLAFLEVGMYQPASPTNASDEADRLTWSQRTETLAGHNHFSAAPAAFRQGMLWAFPER